MIQSWDEVAFLHWSYPSSIVQELLPVGLTVDEWEGHSWVSMVPFGVGLRPSFLPRVTLFRFLEANLRTYVIGPHGEPGIWFFSLDASNLSVVMTARAGYSVPYFWSTMNLEHRPGRLRYQSRRRISDGAAFDLTVSPGSTLDEAQLTEFDHYLTARFTMFASWRNKLLVTRAEHAPWNLRTAAVHGSGDALLAAAGLGPPSDAAIVHWSQGVTARIGFPSLAR
jgi:uncharacterized protein